MIEFLIRDRVELNAFTSDELVAWIEGKLDEHGVEKVVPEEAKLRMIANSTARELVEDRIIEPLIAEAIAKIREEHAALEAIMDSPPSPTSSTRSALGAGRRHSTPCGDTRPRDP